MTSTVGRPRVLTQDELNRALAVRAAYQQWLAQRPPSLRMLARELGVSYNTLKDAVAHVRRYKLPAPETRA